MNTVIMARYGKTIKRQEFDASLLALNVMTAGVRADATQRATLVYIFGETTKAQHDTILITPRVSYPPTLKPVVFISFEL